MLQLALEGVFFALSGRRGVAGGDFASGVLRKKSLEVQTLRPLEGFEDLPFIGRSFCIPKWYFWGITLNGIWYHPKKEARSFSNHQFSGFRWVLLRGLFTWRLESPQKSHMAKISFTYSQRKPIPHRVKPVPRLGKQASLETSRKKIVSYQFSPTPDGYFWNWHLKWHVSLDKNVQIILEPETFVYKWWFQLDDEPNL